MAVIWLLLGDEAMTIEEFHSLRIGSYIRGIRSKKRRRVIHVKGHYFGQHHLFNRYSTWAIRLRKLHSSIYQSGETVYFCSDRNNFSKC